MALARTRSVSLDGVQGHVVEVETDIGAGLPKTILVGLPDASLNEAKDRCRAAVLNSGHTWPNRRVTVALSPASLPKAGSHFDLAIALTVVAAAGDVPADQLDRTVVIGELALDGRLRAVPGVLPAALAASAAGFERIIVPEPNAGEAALLPGMSVLGVRSLRQVTAVLCGEEPPEEPPVPPVSAHSRLAWRGDERVAGLDLADVLGQPEARTSLEVAAAGGHHLFLDGPPGAGKTTLGFGCHTVGVNRAGVYTRISDDRAGDSAGVRRQRDACHKLAADRGLEVVALFEDNSKSAMTGTRPAFRALLEAVRAGKVDCVLVWSVDRLYRRLNDLLELTNTLGSVPVYAVRSGDTDLSTADGRLRANLLGSVAQHESEKRGERVKAAAEQRARAGRFSGGQRRFGYQHRDRHPTSGKPTGPLVLVAAEADALAWAYRHILAGGNLEAVVREWTARGLTGPGGAAFTGTSVRDTLLRPMNAGLATYQQQVVGRTDAIPAVIDEESWQTVRAILTDPRRRTTRGRPPVSLLAGLLRCSVCGARMSARYRHQGAARGHTKTAIYACRRGHVSRVRERLDESLSELVLRRVEQAGGLPVAYRDQPDVPAGVREAEALRDRLQVLHTLVAAGDLDPVDYAAATRETRARLAAVDEQVATATGRNASAALANTGNARQAWAAATVAQRRAVLREHLERVDVGPGTAGQFSLDNVAPTWRS